MNKKDNNITKTDRYHTYIRNDKKIIINPNQTQLTVGIQNKCYLAE